MIDCKENMPEQAEYDRERAIALIKKSKESKPTFDEIEILIRRGSSFVAAGSSQNAPDLIDDSFTLDIVLGLIINHRYVSLRLPNLSFDALKYSLRRGEELLSNVEKDPCVGLGNLDDMREFSPQESAALKIYDPDRIKLSEAIEILKDNIDKPLQLDKQIKSVDRFALESQKDSLVRANSLGISLVELESLYSISLETIGSAGDEEMVIGGDYSLARNFHQLKLPKDIVKVGVEQTLKKLGAKRIKSMKTKVIFKPHVARNILKHFTSLIDGDLLYRSISCLKGKIGERIFPEGLKIWEDPHIPGGLGSSLFDSDFMPTRKNCFVKNGVLISYAIDVYSGRRLGLEPTGNASGVHNLSIQKGSERLNYRDLVSKMRNGIIVDEIIGNGLDPATGNYSVGAAGFLVKDGEIVYPIHEFALAANLLDLFQSIESIGSDIDLRSNFRTGSILCSEISLAGD